MKWKTFYLAASFVLVLLAIKGVPLVPLVLGIAAAGCIHWYKHKTV